jgi:hypothetical protein
MRAAIVASILLVAVIPAQARHVWCFGNKADAFIAKYLPGASIPGDINQAFRYGQRRRGWASCHVPAMGERSDGGVSRCYVKF